MYWICVSINPYFLQTRGESLLPDLFFEIFGNDYVEHYLIDLYEDAKERYFNEDHAAHVIELMRPYLKYKPRHVDALFFIGDSLRVVGLKKEALKYLKKALGLAQNKGSQGIILQRIAKLYETVSPDTADRYFHKASFFHTNKSNPYFWLNRGDNFIKLGDYKKALNCYRKGLRIANDSEAESDINLSIGKIYLIKNNTNKAFYYFQKSKDRNKKNKDATLALKGLTGIKTTLILCSKLRSL